jgi:hypothetical protein
MSRSLRLFFGGNVHHVSLHARISGCLVFTSDMTKLGLAEDHGAGASVCVNSPLIKFAIQILDTFTNNNQNRIPLLTIASEIW